VGHVYKQDPAPGDQASKGNTVTIWVSTGLPKVVVPDVVGDQAPDATAKLAAAHLKPNVVYIHSDKPPGTVTAQDPKGGTRVRRAATVRIKRPGGANPAGVPWVGGEPYAQAAGELQGAGFAVARHDVDSNDPVGTVVAQDPAADSLQAPGTTV